MLIFFVTDCFGCHNMIKPHTAATFDAFAVANILVKTFARILWVFPNPLLSDNNGQVRPGSICTVPSLMGTWKLPLPLSSL